MTLFQIVRRLARVARAVFVLLYRLVMILWNAGPAGRLAVVLGGFVAVFLLLTVVDPVPAATQTAAMAAPIAETTPTPVIVAPTATVEPTPVVIEPTAVVIVEPVATEVPQAIQEMAAPETITPTEAPAAPVEAAPVPPVVTVDQPAASSNASAPCAVGQIKGNDNSHIFHRPGQLAYARTHASVTCFDTATQATAAGYRAAKR